MLDWDKLRSKYTVVDYFLEHFANDLGVIRRYHGFEDWVTFADLYKFFDQKGLILSIDYENFPQHPHFRAKIYHVNTTRVDMLGPWFSDRASAEIQGFERCFEILDVQLKE